MLKEKAQKLALDVIALDSVLPRGRAVDVIVRQLPRSATSVGANYRAACRAKSKPDFISKMGIVEEEADESLYWMEMLVDAGIVSKDKIKQLMEDANEIVAMTVASIKTTRTRSKH
jgi:four helix bundle protein